MLYIWYRFEITTRKSKIMNFFYLNVSLVSFSVLEMVVY